LKYIHALNHNNETKGGDETARGADGEWHTKLLAA